eukprot:scaffold18330_cov72-Phaeocystis_antarctica.AAC.1
MICSVCTQSTSLITAGSSRKRSKLTTWTPAFHAFVLIVQWSANDRPYRAWYTFSRRAPTNCVTTGFQLDLFGKA